VRLIPDIEHDAADTFIAALLDQATMKALVHRGPFVPIPLLERESHTLVDVLKAAKLDRLTALMGDGGIQECGYAQNCVEVCPKDIPLTKSISEVGRDVMKKAIVDFFTT